MNISGLARTVMIVLVLFIVGAVLWWATGYLVALWALPPIVSKVVLTLLIIGGVILLCDLLMSLLGRGFIEWY